MWSYPPHRILVAVDFGDASKRALRVTGELARAFEASVTALHAETFEAPPYFTTGQIRAIDRQRRAARTEAKRYLQNYGERFANMPAAALISDAPARDAILEASRNSDLVVMGTHGRRGPARWWAGSVAEGVVRASTVPVLVVRAPAPANTLFKRIAVIPGPGTFDGPARRYARGLAAQFGGEAARESAPSITAATLRSATIVVIAQPKPGTTFGLASSAAAHVLRQCRRPVLFVPPV
jgi:nucleotide-binding universal stress UspA family protein